MSELENKTEEAPKRKRLTKEEREAAIANGTLKPRPKRTKKTEDGENKEEVKEPTASTDRSKEECDNRTVCLPEEQSVFIMACLHPSTSQKTIEIAKNNGLEVVILEDQVIKDYLDLKRDGDNTKKTIGDFLSNSSNRLKAEESCKKLFTIITEGGRIEDSENYICTLSTVVRSTNLNYNKAKELLILLHTFGLIQYTKGTHEFKFTFSKDLRRNTIFEEIKGMLKVLNQDIQRIKVAIDTDDELKKEEKDEMYKMLMRRIDETIEY